MYRFSEFISQSVAGQPHYMVIGHPIGHTLSPAMHNLAIEHHGLHSRYFAIDLLPEDLASFISWMRRDAFLGTNITIPYKRDLLDAMDLLDETVTAVGAMNTVVNRDGRLTGYNTDVDGFRNPLEPYREDLEGEKAVVFGSGGARLAVLHALHQLNLEEIIIVSRSPGSFEAGEYIVCNYHNWQAHADETALFVNATPLGMNPNRDTSPVEDSDLNVLEDKICYDLVYNPLETRFLMQAKRANARTIDGLSMFIGQGDRAFELWTGQQFPLEAVRQMLVQKLGR